MSKLIEKIWNEEYKPSADTVLFGEDVAHSRAVLEEKERELWKHLDKKSRDIFDDVISAYFYMVSYYKKDSFIQGARFVGRILKEITE